MNITCVSEQYAAPCMIHCIDIHMKIHVQFTNKVFMPFVNFMFIVLFMKDARLVKLGPSLEYF